MTRSMVMDFSPGLMADHMKGLGWMENKMALVNISQAKEK